MYEATYTSQNCSSFQYINVCDDDILLLEEAETLQKGINVLLLCILMYRQWYVYAIRYVPQNDRKGSKRPHVPSCSRVLLSEKCQTYLKLNQFLLSV